MHEIVVDRGEIVAVVEHVHQLLAHMHQRDGAAGREIEPAEQFLPARLGGGMHFRRGFVAGLFAARRRSPLACARDRGRTARPSASKKAMRGPVVSSP